MRRLRFELLLWPVVSVAALAAVVAVALVETEWIVAGFIAVIGLVAIRPVLRTSRAASKLVAQLDSENLPDSPPPSPEQAQALAAVDRFDDSILRAPGVPFTDQVRLDRRKLDALVDRLRTTLGQRPSATAALVDQLDELVQRAQPIPLTDQIRIDRGETYEVLDRIRATIAEEG